MGVLPPMAVNVPLYFGRTDLDALEKEKFFEEYNKRTFDIREKYNVPDGIIQFLYADRGSISPEDCAQIWEVIKDYDDKILYGYPRLPFCARFKDIKEVIRDCIENHCKLKWF